ncbi:MAG TPA: TetR family transcriptional regulator [Candidatus Dormibacteraeota bacterium]|nr:TetR family transcriptional regulator [Candidatus Dormibacteraeota bacterium]
MVGPEDERQRGLTRERLVEASLQLIQADGLEALSMRALADRLDVRAASLYWHVRDRRELLELLAESILESVSRPRRRASWRETVLAICDALGRRVAAQKDAGRVLLEVPESLTRSGTFRDLSSVLKSAGLQSTEAAEVAVMLMTQVITVPERLPQPVNVGTEEPASIAIDTGSRGVILRAGGSDMQGLIHVPADQGGAAPAVVRGEQVVVRRLRGVGRGEIELNPGRSWRFKVQAPTWNTVIDAAGLDVREIHVDSGATNVECFLPAPVGVVPIHLSSGVINVALHRPPGAAVVAKVHPGTVKLRLDSFASRVVVTDVHWQSDGALEARDRYELEVSGGVVDLTLDSYTPKSVRANVLPAPPQATGKAASALEILLDGVQARVASRN